jgi:signal peptidase I
VIFLSVVKIAHALYDLKGPVYVWGAVALTGSTDYQAYSRRHNAPVAAGPTRARRWVGLVLLLAVLYVLYLVQTRRVEYFMVTSDSMQPTLQVGQTYRMVPTHEYLRGQIVVFLSPQDHATRLVKRLVAMGGDRVELRDGFLFVNAQRNNPPQGPSAPIDLSDQAWDIGADEVFVVGDNRPYSHDSREFGAIRRHDLLGVLDPKPRGGSWWNKIF